MDTFKIFGTSLFSTLTEFTWLFTVAFMVGVQTSLASWETLYLLYQCIIFILHSALNNFVFLPWEHSPPLTTHVATWMPPNSGVLKFGNIRTFIYITVLSNMTKHIFCQMQFTFFVPNLFFAQSGSWIRTYTCVYAAMNGILRTFEISQDKLPANIWIPTALIVSN